jgi:hypothetical protein
MKLVKTLIMLLPFALFACKQGEDAAVLLNAMP